ncbi:hypothetical protein BU14_0457s0012 [Porphyra umbilicalis]|uniref:Uncharacterized protein n=1 Tax=Porphyra umbilicalis TaxID=2786 RepID=A0A1X6NUB4_PORUM|nr:hypothetical protein BU14_0457s0012 [Porphyra umbilicalis]|eukprot:OSX72219.1 hypothetical protein BU14_0457s0012 [Porphyra umbilicalis]
MDTLRSGSACSKNHPATAWPASWWATISRSFLETTLLRFSKPPITRSAAASKSSTRTAVCSWRAAMSAASLHTLAISAPAKPGVSVASFLAIASRGVSTLMPFRSGAASTVADAAAPAALPPSLVVASLQVSLPTPASAPAPLVLVLTVALTAAAAPAAVASPCLAAAPGTPAGAAAAAAAAATPAGSANFNGPRWTLKISKRPRMSGLSIVIWRSKRPGRSSALSKMSARFVPASTTTPDDEEKPSISTSSALRVFSRSSDPPEKPPRPRARPMASISSIKTMHGADARAVANRSRTRDGPTPTNISIKSEPDMEKKGTLASPAVALASSVLPVPGGPTRRAPLGILAPRRVYLGAFWRKSTNSMTSTLASSKPATSANLVTFSPGTPVAPLPRTTTGLALPT